MADPSFDVVSKVDRQEVDNALNQAAKELAQRFDFRGTNASIAWAGEEAVPLQADSEERVKAALDVFKEKLIKRGISLKALDAGDPQASGRTYKVPARIKQGIESDQARSIAKRIRDQGPKGVQAQIQGDQLRVSAKKKDDLQAVIRMLKDADLDVPAAVHQLPLTRVAPAAGRGRVLLLTGAPGSGKTAGRGPPAAAARRGRARHGRLPAGREPARRGRPQAPARVVGLQRPRLGFAGTVLGAGHDVLLLSPLTPAEVDRSNAAPVLGAARWAVLDCADGTRRRRLAARSCSERAVADALADAAELRALGLPVLRSDAGDVAGTAGRIAAWARAPHAGER